MRGTLVGEMVSPLIYRFGRMAWLLELTDMVLEVRGLMYLVMTIVELIQRTVVPYHLSIEGNSIELIRSASIALFVEPAPTYVSGPM
jgi:hypothetical protein